MTKIKFPYYHGNVKNTIPLGEVTLEQFIKGNKNPKPKIKEVFKQIEEATATGNLKLKSELKQNNLVFFTPSVKTDGKGRSYKNIIGWNNIVVLDFDGLSKEMAVELKQHLFNDFKSCICSWISPSGYGVKALMKSVPFNSVEEFKSVGAGLGTIFEWYTGWDASSVTNPILPLFLSWDPDMLVRDFEEAEEFKLRGFKETLFEPFEGELPDSSSFSEEEINKVIETIKFYINRIDGNGHPAVCSTSLLAGSMQKYYSIPLQEILEQAIEENAYLQKDVVGYIRTSRQLFEKGLQNPQPLKSYG